MTDEELLKRAVETAGFRAAKKLPRWAHIMDVFLLGSTSAYTLCKRFDIDPEAKRGGCSECEEQEE